MPLVVSERVRFRLGVKFWTISLVSIHCCWLVLVHRTNASNGALLSPSINSAGCCVLPCRTQTSGNEGCDDCGGGDNEDSDDVVMAVGGMAVVFFGFCCLGLVVRDLTRD